MRAPERGGVCLSDRLRDPLPGADECVLEFRTLKQQSGGPGDPEVEAENAYRMGIDRRWALEHASVIELEPSAIVFSDQLEFACQGVLFEVERSETKFVSRREVSDGESPVVDPRRAVSPCQGERPQWTFHRVEPLVRFSALSDIGQTEIEHGQPVEMEVETPCSLCRRGEGGHGGGRRCGRARGCGGDSGHGSRRGRGTR